MLRRPFSLAAVLDRMRPFFLPQMTGASTPFVAFGLLALVSYGLGFGAWAFGEPVVCQIAVGVMLALYVVRALFVGSDDPEGSVGWSIHQFDRVLLFAFGVSALTGLGPLDFWTDPPSLFLKLQLGVWGLSFAGAGLIKAGQLIYRRPIFYQFGRKLLRAIAVLIGGLVLALAGLVLPASAAPVCNQREVAVAGLEHRFGEAPIWRGLNGKGNVVELWVNPETGSWTYLLSPPDGRSCFIDQGSFWEGVDFAPPAQGEPS